MRKTTIEIQMALSKIQDTIYNQLKKKVDVYYQEGKGVLVVLSGSLLRPENVLYKVSEAVLQSETVRITRVRRQAERESNWSHYYGTDY